MSDSHIGWPGEPGVTGFEKALAHANRLKPAFVVVTGDLVDAPNDLAMTARFKNIAAKLDKSIPLYLVPGNHDVRDTPTPASLTFYRREIGRDNYSLDVRGCHLVVFNSEIVNRPQASGNEEQQQLAWLTADLEEAAAHKPTHIMIFSHHPIFVSRPDEPDAHGNLPQARRQIYLSLLKKYGVTAAFSGHEHYNAIGRYGDTEMITTASLCKPFFGVAGFRIVKVYRDHIEHKFFTLQNPPSEVRLDARQAAKEQGHDAVSTACDHRLCWRRKINQGARHLTHE